MAPLALVQLALPALTEAGGTVVDITSDAAVEGYEGWGGYGSSKAALDQLGNVLAAEHPDLRVYSFDPGDMRTADAPGRVPRARTSRTGRSRRGSRPSCAGSSPTPRRAAATAPPTCGRRHDRHRGGTARSACAFDLPPTLEAGSPPEARGLTRDAVRMLVAHRDTGAIEHSTFAILPAFLEPGDLVVVNTSATIPAAVDAVGRRRHAARRPPLDPGLDAERWVVEPRRPTRTEHGALGRARRRCPPCGSDDGATATIEEPYGTGGRLWVARLRLPQRPLAWLAAHGRPIRYGYVERPWPLSAYQNVYATEPGSAEMPSAGRPFTPEVITRLVAKGVGVSPHRAAHRRGLAGGRRAAVPGAGRVPADDGRAGQRRARLGHRVIAVGTTVVRALETAADAAGVVGAFDGWTDLVITPERGVRAIDGLLTGWHEPEASHLLMLEAVAGRDLLRRSYEASLASGYLWHEFGDVHLILP